MEEDQYEWSGNTKVMIDELMKAVKVCTQNYENGWDREDLFRDRVYPIQPHDNDNVMPWSSGDIERVSEEIERQKNREREVKQSALDKFREEIEKRAIQEKQRQAREAAIKQAAREKTQEEVELEKQNERIKQRYKDIQRQKMIEKLKTVKKPVENEPVKEVQVKNTMFLKCINNLGIEDRFDLDSAYEGFVHSDKEMIWVIGKDGIKDEYLKERFEELPE